MIHFSRWAVSEAIIVPQAETSLFIPGFDVYLGLRAVGRLCVAEKSSSIFLVSDDRILYVVDLQSLEFKEPAFVTQKGSITQNHPYCQTSYLVSRAGSRVVGIYIRCSQWVNFTTGENKEEQLATQDSSNIVIELKFADLFGAIDQTQTFELKYPDPRYRPVHLRSKQSSSDHSITFSPDLSILQTGPHIFDLSAPSQRRLTFHESPLDRWQHGESQCVSFSACNGYLIIFDGVEDGVYRTRKAEVEGATFELFRICRAAGQIEKIPMEAPDDLVADSVWAAFHPILPLLLLTYINCPKNDVKGRAKVTEIDLRTFKAVQITVPNHDGVKRKE